MLAAAGWVDAIFRSPRRGSRIAGRLRAEPSVGVAGHVSRPANPPLSEPLPRPGPARARVSPACPGQSHDQPCGGRAARAAARAAATSASRSCCAANCPGLELHAAGGRHDPAAALLHAGGHRRHGRGSLVGGSAARPIDERPEIEPGPLVELAPLDQRGHDGEVDAVEEFGEHRLLGGERVVVGRSSRRTTSGRSCRPGPRRLPPSAPKTSLSVRHFIRRPLILPGEFVGIAGDRVVVGLEPESRQRRGRARPAGTIDR